MTKFINYWKYTKSVWFMCRIIIAWILYYINGIANSSKLYDIVSNMCYKEYIFNTPFWKYIWASLFWYMQMNENYEKDIKKVVYKYSKELSNEKSKYLINIGCNIWRWAIDLSKNYNYNVIAFEPAPETYYRFCTNVAFSWLLDKFDTYNIWLWNKNWIINFEYNIKDNWVAHIVESLDSNKDIIQIPVKKFDDLWIDKEKIQKTRLIIMDVEWYELNVLKWMEKSLKEFKDVNIVVEIWENHEDKEKTIDYMKSLWYQVKSIDKDNWLFSK